MATVDEKLLKAKALRELGQKVYDEYATKQEVTELSGKVSTLESANGEENVIEEIQVNGSKVDPQGKTVNITVPKDTGDLTNNSDFQTGTDVDGKIKAQIGSVYKPAGSTTFAELPTPGAENLGSVYNVTDGFTTDEKFVEGEGKEYPAGTNAVVVNSDGYKFDVLSGIVDLTDYAKTEALTAGLAAKAEKTHTHKTSEISDLTAALGEYVTSESLTSQLAGKAETEHEHTVSEITDLEIASDEEVTAMLAEVFSPAE